MNQLCQDLLHCQLMGPRVVGQYCAVSQSLVVNVQLSPTVQHPVAANVRTLYF